MSRHEISEKFVVGKINADGLKSVIPFMGLVVVIIFFQIASDGRLLTVTNMPVFISHAFAIIVASCGAVFLMAQGNLDFSMAGNVCVVAAITANVSQSSIPLAILAALLCGSFLGLLNGLIHTLLGLPSFVATLATSFIFTGVANVLLGSGSLAANYDLKKFDDPVLLLSILGVVLLATFFVLEFSPFGKQSKAIGARVEVARQSGVNITYRKITPFVICGCACGLIAIFSLLRTCTASTTTGAGIQINTIIALLLGGIPFSGGWTARFRGVVIGALLMAVVINGLVIMNVPIITQQIIKGILFVIAVAIAFDRKNTTVIK
jgi:ribose transport system permease protein